MLAASTAGGPREASKTISMCGRKKEREWGGGGAEVSGFSLGLGCVWRRGEESDINRGQRIPVLSLVVIL